MQNAREKVLELGERMCDNIRRTFVKKVRIPFNVALMGLITGSIGDKSGESFFEKLAVSLGGVEKVPLTLHAKSDEELEEFAEKSLRIRWSVDKRKEAIKGLLALDRKYDLKKKDLRGVAKPDEFYRKFIRVPLFGGEEIGPWVGLEYVRSFELKCPSQLKMPGSTKKALEILGLSLNDFEVEEYPIVDAAFEYRDSRGVKLRTYAKKDPQMFLNIFKSL